MFERKTRIRVVLGAVFLLLGHHTGHAQADGRSAAERSGDAHVQPGDKVIVRISREPLLGDTVMVSARGEIVLGKVGQIAASTMTIHALEDTVRLRYARFLRNPAVNLVVLRRIVVNGEVAKPNVYFVDVSTTLRDIIATAGGITEAGDPSRVTIQRGNLRIAAPAWREDSSVASDLMSGDEVVVGQRSWLERNALSAASTTILFVSVLFTVLRR